MTPFIAKLIERSCVTTHADCPLDDLIEILAERRIGTVVVVDRDHQVTGIGVKQLYGRVLPIHLERAGLRGDSYLD